MIQWLHALSKSWVAVVLMGGLALSFVVWGIADVFTGAPTTGVASVGGTEIDAQTFSRAYRSFVRNESQRMGGDISPDMAQKMGLGTVALQQIISRTALDNETARLGLTTPDSAVAENVRSFTQFRGPLGQFNHATFLQVVQTAGYTEDEFLGEIRGDLTRSQLTNAVEADFQLPPGYAQALVLYINERRAADYVVLSPDKAGAVAPPSDAVLSAYLKLHPERFSTPQYRSADYASITPDDVTGALTVSDAQILQEYNAHKDAYVIPEKRTIEQMEFKTQADATAARAKIAAGSSFEAIAAQQGLKPAQIALGTLAQSDLPDPDRAKAIFALPVNAVSPPIKGAFGSWALARVTAITPGTNKTLADVKDDIRKALLQQLAAAKLIDIVNSYTDGRSSGASLVEAARKAGMKTGHVQAVDQTGMTPQGTRADVPNDPDFLAGVAKAEVGADTDPITAKSGAYYVIRVGGVTPPKLKPLDQVRAELLAAWTEEQRGKLLAMRVAALTAQAQKEKSLDGIARTLGVSVQHSPSLSRGTNDTMFSGTLVEKLFDAAPGAIVEGPQGQSNGYVIARLTGITHPPIDVRTAGFRDGAEKLSGTVAGDFSIALANAARARQGVHVNQQAVDAAVGGGQ